MKEPCRLDIMPFDPAMFEDELTLKLIPREKLPTVAQEALEAGFDGPNVLRMAILEPTAGWGIDQALPGMLDELGCALISPREAALRLARRHAATLLMSGDDPSPSVAYFYRLMVAADHARELIELGYFDDEVFYDFDDPEERRSRMREALEGLLSPELYQQRLAERKAVWDRDLAKAQSEWPYVLNSATGRALWKKRYVEKIRELRPFLWIQSVAWILVGWAFSSWRTAVVGYLVSVLMIFMMPIGGQYLRMRSERRDLLLRRRA